jgi:hypothetical protein
MGTVTKLNKNVGSQFEKKIQDDWKPQIMAWSVEGLSLSKIVVKIKETWNVDITITGVSKIIIQIKKERSAVTKALVQEDLGNHVNSDLKVLDDKKKELVELSNRFKKEEDWSNYKVINSLLKELLKLSFDMMGANEKKSDDENAQSDLINSFNKLINKK